MIRPAAPRLPAENLWLLPYPLKMLGADLRRNGTLIRLHSGKMIVHSTVPFSPEDVATILGWDFDRVIVGHAELIEFDGKAKLRAALAAADFSIA